MSLLGRKSAALLIAGMARGLVVGLVMFTAAEAAASTVGVPITSLTDNTPVATDNVDSDGTIHFFVLLSGTATFGVDGGTNSDSCVSPGCTGGTLIMFLEYDPVTPGPNLVTLDFNDLDLIGVNDPNGFFESIEFYDSDGTTLLAAVSDMTDPEVVFADFDEQLIQIAIPNAGNPFRAKLTLMSGSAPFDQATNTGETLLTTIDNVSVAHTPIPGAVWLFASALMGLVGFSRLRRSATQA